MQCPVCKTTLPDGARFCNVCGTAVSQQAVCAECGQPVKPGQKFCMNCGAPITAGVAAAGMVSPPETATPVIAEPAQIIPPPRAPTQAPPERRGRWWLWLIPVALLAALVVAAVALDLPGRLSQATQTARRTGDRGTATDPDALWRQAQEQQATGSWPEVLALLTQLRAADPEGTRRRASYQPTEVSALLAAACTNLARQAEQAGDPAAAGTHWACVLQERPGDAEATAGKGRADLYLAGQAALEAGRHPEAIAAWDELHRVAPDYADVADRLYRAYLAYGDALCARRTPADIQEGRKQYGLARALDPARPEVIEKLRACQQPTATPLPTTPPTSTPTPLPGPHLGVIADDVTTLRVRSGPGVGYFVLGKLTAGDAVTITGRTADAAWLQVEASPERTGWVSSEYVKANYPAEAAPITATPPLPQRLVVAQASADFSNQQGFRDWFYLTSTAPGSSKYVRMPFDNDGTYRWCCHANYSSAMRIWSAGAYPSRNNDAVRLWVSPYDGQLHIYGVARKEPYFGAGGNGSLVRILQNKDVLWEDSLGSRETDWTAFDLTVTSKPGDEFYFVVGARGDDLGDSTIFDPTIELLHMQGADLPPPERWAEAVGPTPTPSPTSPPSPALCFEPRLRHYEEHKGCCAEVAGLVYNRQGQPYGPRGSVVHIEGPPAPRRYVMEFGVDAGGGYTITALSVDKYTIWLKGPNIRSKQYAVEYPDWAKIRIIVDFYQVACW